MVLLKFSWVCSDGQKPSNSHQVQKLTLKQGPQLLLPGSEWRLALWRALLACSVCTALAERSLSCPLGKAMTSGVSGIRSPGTATRRLGFCCGHGACVVLLWRDTGCAVWWRKRHGMAWDGTAWSDEHVEKRLRICQSCLHFLTPCSAHWALSHTECSVSSVPLMLSDSEALSAARGEGIQHEHWGESFYPQTSSPSLIN